MELTRHWHDEAAAKERHGRNARGPHRASIGSPLIFIVPSGVVPRLEEQHPTRRNEYCARRVGH